jgi:hypothetical protein
MIGPSNKGKPSRHARDEKVVQAVYARRRGINPWVNTELPYTSSDLTVTRLRTVWCAMSFPLEASTSTTLVLFHGMGQLILL